MVKLWDSKLVKLRQDMNIHAIVKRIGEKADTVEVKDAIDTSNTRIDGLESTFVHLINEIENVNR